MLPATQTGVSQNPYSVASTHWYQPEFVYVYRSLGIPAYFESPSILHSGRFNSEVDGRSDIPRIEGEVVLGDEFRVHRVFETRLD